MQTRAIVFPGPNRAVLDEIPLPDPETEDVVVELEMSGVSVGTERWAYKGLRPEITFPNVPGYMGIGRVVEAGKQAAARGFRDGMRVNFFSARMVPPYDGSWMAAHLARAVVRTAEPPPPGSFDVHRILPVPEGLRPEGASLTGLCGVALRGIEMAVIPVGARVLVVGLGILGQYAAQVCRIKGARVCAADVDGARLELAAKLGAEWTVNPAAEDMPARAAALAPGGFDIIIDTSSKPEVVNTLFPLLALRGRFVFQGWYPPPSSLDLHAIQNRLATCYFPSAHNDAAVAAAMQWTADGRLNTEALITHRPRPEEAPEIYRMIDENREPFLGVVFDWRPA
ncbi:MAG: zinc-binding alcohol dehydrogenase [Lentisphaerae bacterium]|nr:zinc-binding alcohol dehydrogenase [Lentisphaerota bacterium]